MAAWAWYRWRSNPRGVPFISKFELLRRDPGNPGIMSEADTCVLLSVMGEAGC